MSRLENLVAALNTAPGDKLVSVDIRLGETTAIVRAQDLMSVARTVRDEPELRFAQLIDLSPTYLHSTNWLEVT